MDSAGNTTVANIRSVTRATLVSWMYAIGVIFVMAIADTPPEGVELNPLRFWVIAACAVALSYTVWVFWDSAETAARFSIGRYDGDERYMQAAWRNFAWTTAPSGYGGVASVVLIFGGAPWRYTPLLGMALACAVAALQLAKYANVISTVGDGSPLAGAPPIDPGDVPADLSARGLRIPRKAVPLIVATSVSLWLVVAVLLLDLGTAPFLWCAWILIMVLFSLVGWLKEFWNDALLGREAWSALRETEYRRARAVDKVLNDISLVSFFAGLASLWLNPGLSMFHLAGAIATLLAVAILIASPAYFLKRFDGVET